jgi:hypothetical protein
MTECRYCGRVIIRADGRWVDPEATGEDSVWRETCDRHDTFTAEHEPDGWEGNEELAEEHRAGLHARTRQDCPLCPADAVSISRYGTKCQYAGTFTAFQHKPEGVEYE